MKITKKIVCAPIVTLTLLVSLIGGASLVSCKSDSPITCGKCYGVGKIEASKQQCPSCSGKGEHTTRCGRCSGRKTTSCNYETTLSQKSAGRAITQLLGHQVDWDVRCVNGTFKEVTNGSVHDYSDKGKCSRCSGSGRVSCYSCSGSGTQDSSCSKCAGKGEVTIPESKCGTCEGSGTITKK